MRLTTVIQFSNSMHACLQTLVYTYINKNITNMNTYLHTSVNSLKPTYKHIANMHTCINTQTYQLVRKVAVATARHALANGRLHQP